jgi:hypothetical protein
VAAGGFVAAQQARLEERAIEMTLRVPSPRFRATLDAVSQLGRVVDADLSTDDVTEQVVDLESRIASGRASVARLRELLGGAGDVSQLAAVESELARREADVESLVGRLRVLEDQVALSTITLRLVEPAPVAAQDGDLPGFVQALSDGWGALVLVASVVVAGVGYTLPLAVVAALAALTVLAVRRGRRAPAPR